MLLASFGFPAAFSHRIAAQIVGKEDVENDMRMRLGLGLICALLLACAAGFLWLRNSPYWAGITLFTEANRVENFRAMDDVFPSRVVAATGHPWAFEEDPQALPESFEFDGQQQSLAQFLDKTTTTGLIVVQDGTILHEEYRLGASAASRFTSWSLAKSVLSALIGIALDEGHIASLDDPIDRYVPALASSGYVGVSIRDALTMSSGVAFDEDYNNPVSDVNRLFFALAAGTAMEDLLTPLERARTPGTYNNYVSSDSIALGLVLEAATGIPNEEYLETRLWGPMGAEGDAFWNTGRNGPVLPFCCLNATLRDYARFGRLYLEGGAREDMQVVPRDWVHASTTPSAPHLEPGDNPASFWTFGYGYHWWIPEAPQDEFLAIGIWGQYIYIDRGRNIVIVKTSADYDFDTRDHETVAAFRSISNAFSAAGKDASGLN
ncbi:serine hydrolase [uncultured Roseobacter sp.]|uniref:serine hydrolase domain-containing protein n=1 Tax=uncultured Roseobacter sp. TaxID=114847 RepID=UPI00261C6ED9|nr:serine hydrolase [uncultured Roseobacter sp.]